MFVLDLDVRIDPAQMPDQIVGLGREKADIDETDAGLVDVEIAELALSVGHPGDAVDVGDLHRLFFVFGREQRSFFIVDGTLDDGQGKPDHSGDRSQIQGHPHNMPSGTLGADQGNIGDLAHDRDSAEDPGQALGVAEVGIRGFHAVKVELFSFRCVKLPDFATFAK